MTENNFQQSKVIVEAEIHTPQNKKLNNYHKKIDEKPCPETSNKSQQEFDEIKLIQSANSVLKKDLKSPVQPNKPRWSLRIKLQPTVNLNGI